MLDGRLALPRESPSVRRNSCLLICPCKKLHPTTVCIQETGKAKEGFEPTTHALQKRCSTPELFGQRITRSFNGTSDLQEWRNTLKIGPYNQYRETYEESIREEGPIRLCGLTLVRPPSSY